MIRPVAGTVAARVAITAMNLLIVVVGGQRLGAEGLGTIGLVVLGITMILMLGHVVGGGGLVYVVPRLGVRPLLAPSYGWAVLTAGAAFAMLQVVPFVPDEVAMHVVVLAFLQSLNSIHLNILLGRERFALQNAILVGQTAIQLVAFTALLGIGDRTVMDYIAATYITHVATAAISFAVAFRYMMETAPATTTPVLPALFKQGGLAQGANLLQLLNYRLSYYLIEHFQGRGALGLYSVTTQLAESAWLVPKSIGGVLYSKVSNLEEAERQRDLTVILLKVSVVVGLLCSLALIALPEGVYSTVFGPEITGLRPLLVRLLPGLVAMSASQVLSHYLSGTGRIMHNTIGSGLGLFVTVAAGWWLIPDQGLEGAALTASLAYSSSTLYQLMVFLRLTKTRLIDLWPHAGDTQRLWRVWSGLSRR